MRWTVVFIVAIISCYMGFINGFPLVYSDTGSYISMGFKNIVLVDRPIMYGLFLRHLSLEESLWIPIIVQALMLAYLVCLVFKYFSGKTQFTGQYLFFYFSILLFTGVSVNVSQLMPDVFTPAVILCAILLLLAKNISRSDAIIVGVLLVLSSMMHASHFAIIGIIFFCGVVLKIIAWIRKKHFFISVKRGLLVFSLTVFSWFSLCTLHYSLDGGFAVTRGSSVFLINRLIDMGILDPYLRDECKNHDWKICDYQGQFNTDFLWDYGQSPLYKMGGWEKNSEEFNQVMRGVLSSSTYLKKFLFRSAEASLQQFFMFNVEQPYSYGEESAVFGALNEHLRFCIRNYKASKQFGNRINFELLNFFQQIFIFCMLLVLVYLLAGDKMSEQTRSLTILIILFVAANAIATGTLSGVVDPYQARVVWLLVLPVFIHLTEIDFLSRIKNWFR